MMTPSPQAPAEPGGRPRVSVVVPVYNVEPYIAKCLGSLEGQTLRDMEFIIVDDCGSDRSMDITREYAARDSRFLILEGDKNMGVGPARNRGMDAARGEYVGFVDPDDWVTPDFFQQLYETAIAEQADVAKGRLIYVDGESSTENTLNKRIAECIRNSRWPGVEFTQDFYTAIFRTELLRRRQISFPPIRNGEDTAFITSYLLHANKVALNNVAIYFYFQREGSLSRTIDEQFYESLFQSMEFRGKLVNTSSLPKEDILGFWHNKFRGSILCYSIRHAVNESQEFYIKYFTRAKEIFLSSGHAQALYELHPLPIYRDLIEKTPEEIYHSWQDILPILNRPSPPAPQKAKQAQQPPQQQASKQPPQKQAPKQPDIAAYAWRYPVYRRRYRYCQLMAMLTMGKKREHYKRKRQAYRQLLRDIRHYVRSAMNQHHLPW